MAFPSPQPSPGGRGSSTEVISHSAQGLRTAKHRQHPPAHSHSTQGSRTDKNLQHLSFSPLSLWERVRGREGRAGCSESRSATASRRHARPAI